MNDIFTERLISFRELALMAFALYLLAAAPSSDESIESAQQPVNVVVPANQGEEVLLNEA